jgi:tetratricopeptide (TPR) repeat protein
MKTFYKRFYILLVILLYSQLFLVAQNKEITITTSSKEALKLFLDAETKLENAEYLAAAPIFDKAIELDNNFALAYLYRAISGGDYNILTKNLDKAVSLMDKITEGEKLIILYFQAAVNGNGLKQKEYIEQLIKLYPLDKRVQYNAGIYYYGIFDYKNALLYLTKTTDLDKNYAAAYNLSGYSQSKLNNFPEAEKAFQAYIKLKPNSPNPYDSYAELLLKMGKYDESIAQYKKALEKDPKFISSFVGIGNNYIFKNDFESARKYYQEYYDKSTTTDSKFNALYWIAVSYIHEGNVEKAIKTFDDYRTLAEKEKLIPNIIYSYSTSAWILAENKRYDEGYKYTEKAIDLIDKSKLSEAEEETYSMYTMLWNLGHFIDIGKYENANTQIEKCKQKLDILKNQGEEMWLNSLLGLMELKRGNYEKAIEYYGNANQESPEIWYQTAMAYKNKSEKQNAVKLFEKVAKCNVNSIELAFVRKKAMEELKK